MLMLRDIRKSYGTTVAVDGLSLDVAAGEVFGLLGPNGAGKSTAIAISTGLLAPDSGSVDVLGLGSPREAKVRIHLGLAPQEITLYDELTARENLTFFGRLYGVVRLRERVDELLALVELDTRARDRVGAFSGGMKRRLNLAAALVHDPSLVLLDEPTAGVDPQSRNRILELVRTLAGSGKTIIYTTHYMDEAAKVCDRVGIVDHGRMLDVGTVAELLARHTGEADLESVFLALTGRSLRE